MAKNPWIVNPKWETFKIETSLKKICEEVAQNVGFKEENYKEREERDYTNYSQWLKNVEMFRKYLHG